MMLQRATLDYCPAGEIEKCCYIRLPQGDVQAAIEILEKHGIGVTSVEESISVILTQRAKESAFEAAMAELGNVIRLRLEDFE